MKRQPGNDHSLLICLLAIFLVNSPLKQWLTALDLPWYAMFAPWLLIIVLLAFNHLRQARGD